MSFLFVSARRLAGVFILIGGLVGVLGLTGCALIVPQSSKIERAKPSLLPDNVELSEVPFFPQKNYECGPAALATVLANAKLKVTPDDLVSQVYLPSRKGSLQVEMLASARRHGMIAYQLAPRFEDLLREVAAGNPVIVLQDYGVWPFSIWHYAVVIGYDYRKSLVILRSGENKRLLMPFGILEYTWKESNYWAMVATQADRIPATATESAYLAAIAAADRLGDAKNSRTAYSAALAKWPENLQATIGLANAHYSLGALDKTEITLKKGLSRNPLSVVLLNNLAQTLSDLGRHAEALSYIEQAIKLGGPFSAMVDDTHKSILQKVKFKKGK